VQKSDLNTSDLRVAIVGAGNICKHAHIPALLRLGAAIVSITDPNQRALDAIRPLVPSSVKLLGSAACEISEQANCAIVCSPSALHAEQVQRLLRSGVHVLCEKPLACTFADAQGLRDQAAAGGLVLQVGYFRRFHPTTTTLSNC
jgi:predicted dehydrogenase